MGLFTSWIILGWVGSASLVIVAFWPLGTGKLTGT